MSQLLQVEIVTPERAVFSAEATEVLVPGVDGELGILPGHLPLFTTIRVGAMTVKTVNDGERIFCIEGGFAEILPHGVTILTDSCEGSEDSDVSMAQEMVEKAEAALKALQEDKEDVHHELREDYYDALDRARRRLAFSEEHKK